MSYDTEQDTFQVSDPGICAERRAIKKDVLDRARRQHGKAAAPAADDVRLTRARLF